MAIVEASITKPLYNGVAILGLQNNETADMLLFWVKPVGVELFSVIAFFCSNKFA